MAKALRGFKAVSNKIAKSYQSKGMDPAKAKEVAGAALAKSTRNASPAAKKANPRLNRVKG